MILCHSYRDIKPGSKLDAVYAYYHFSLILYRLRHYVEVSIFRLGLYTIFYDYQKRWILLHTTLYIKAITFFQGHVKPIPVNSVLNWRTLALKRGHQITKTVPTWKTSEKYNTVSVFLFMGERKIILLLFILAKNRIFRN